MILLSLLLLQASPVFGPPSSARDQLEQCVGLATRDPVAAEQSANRWLLGDGGFLANQCLGISLANRELWPAAASAFDSAARAAEAAKDVRAANYWAQAGNAWLVAGEPEKARGALDAALAAGTLEGLALGEAHLDRARALVSLGSPDAARPDLDAAVGLAPTDPLAWLLSATLARRMDELSRAKQDIAKALELSPDDARVQLEAGNIAARTQDEAGAKAAWQRAAQLAPGSETALSAAQALKQFDP